MALPLAGHVVLRLGARRALRVFSVVCAGGVMVFGAGVSAQLALLAAIGLFVFGLGTSLWDVAMNVEGAAVEQGLRRSIMPRFHASWSLGSVAGALVGAGFAALGAPLVVHLLIAGGVCLVAGPGWPAGWFLAADPHGEAHQAPASRRAAGLDRASYLADRRRHAVRRAGRGRRQRLVRPEPSSTATTSEMCSGHWALASSSR